MNQIIKHKSKAFQLETTPLWCQCVNSCCQHPVYLFCSTISLFTLCTRPVSPSNPLHSSWFSSAVFKALLYNVLQSNHNLMYLQEAVTMATIPCRHRRIFKNLSAEVFFRVSFFLISIAVVLRVSREAVNTLDRSRCALPALSIFKTDLHSETSLLSICLCSSLENLHPVH